MDGVRTFLMARGAQVLLLLHPPFDVVGAGPGLHQGLSARRPRERRSVHARGRVDRDGAGPARQRRRSGRGVPHAQSGESRPARGRRRALPDRAVRARRRRLQPSRPIADAAGGAGTRDRPAGCIARASRAFSACAAPARRSPSTRAFRRRGRSIRSSGDTSTRGTTSPSRIPSGAVAACARRRSTASPVDHLAIPLVNDGAVHHVAIVLGAASRRETSVRARRGPGRHCHSPWPDGLSVPAPAARRLLHPRAVAKQSPTHQGVPLSRIRRYLITMTTCFRARHFSITSA